MTIAKSQNYLGHSTTKQGPSVARITFTEGANNSPRVSQSSSDTNERFLLNAKGDKVHRAQEVQHPQTRFQRQ